MSKLHRPRLKAITLSLIATTIFIAAQSVTRADEVTFNASTAGCFDPPGCASSSFLGLSFTASGFSGTSGAGTSESRLNFTQGFLALNDLGSFTLNTDPSFYNGTFQLRITFTMPDNLIGGQVKTFSADVLGLVVSQQEGLVLINFDNTPVPFTFDGTDISGGFQLAIFDVLLAPGGTGILRGEIMGAQQTVIPEPATLALLATGLTSLAGATRRRRKQRRLSSE